MIKNLSVFFPLFNEAGNVETTVKKAVEVLQKLKLGYEIILINDGSKDGTKRVAEGLSKENPSIRVINHEKNLGYGEALKSGFYNAKYDTIVYTDGDGQFDFSEVTKFLDKIDDYDLLIGYRIKRQDPFFRILFKKGWTFALWTMFGLTLKDVDCGFKMIKREVLEAIPHLESQRGAMINAELAIKAKKNGFRVGQIGVDHYPRLSGRPTGASLNVIIRSFTDLFKLWWKLKEQKFLFILLAGILLLAAFLRFYKIDQYMLFLGDEGRDALIVKEIVEGRHFPLIGPPTSVGNIYLGPLYYYMMAIPMFIFNLNPVSAAGMNAAIGVLTVFLVYILGKLWFGREAGLISSLLYAVSPVTINYSNFSWNPNPTPFFALLVILSLDKFHKLGNYKWLILTAASAAAALQMHYLALILLPVLVVGWLKELLAKKSPLFWGGTILALLTFFLFMSPLLLFDLRHNFLNFKAITALFFGQDTSVGFNIVDSLQRIPQIFSQSLIGRYLTAENPVLTFIVSILILIPLIYTGYLMYQKRSFNYGFWILNNWLLIGILGLSFYKQQIFDHYLNFLNPAPFLLFGSLVKLKKIFLAPVLVLVVVLTFVNLAKNPLNLPPNKQLERSQQVAKFVIEKSHREDFNFALLAENNYDSAYIFYLEKYGHKPKIVPQEKTTQLFVVCEDQICDPTHSAKYEVAAFGMSKIDWMEEYFGVKIYRLIPNPSGRP
ncbi:glycosyltransferase [Candidatus Daviesbacteria bacterium]|nr:glycosyltransferase [Candidatus Daviesbacteria bacterium]